MINKSLNNYDATEIKGKGFLCFKCNNTIQYHSLICYLCRRISYAQTQGSQTRMYDFLRALSKKMCDLCAFVIQCYAFPLYFIVV